jgi:hypothetical protein
VDSDGVSDERQEPGQGSPPAAGTPVPPMPVGPPAALVPATPTNGFAVASLVLGIMAVVLCWTIYLGIGLGVLAIVFGAFGIGRARAIEASKGMAVAGLVLGIVGVAISLVLILMFVAFFTNSGSFQQIRDCVQHPKTC